MLISRQERVLPAECVGSELKRLTCTCVDVMGDASHPLDKKNFQLLQAQLQALHDPRYRLYSNGMLLRDSFQNQALLSHVLPAPGKEHGECSSYFEGRPRRSCGVACSRSCRRWGR